MVGTERLYYTDSYLTRFTARVLETCGDSRLVYLDRTAFYPTSGGQPHDLGTLGGAEVVDVIDEGERIAHRLAQPLTAQGVEGVVNWQRRFDHMQQHTGQHLVSAVAERLFAAKTTSVHFGPESSTVELALDSLAPGQLRDLETAANAAVTDNLPITVAFEEAEQAGELRRPTGRQGALRIVTIKDLDRSACGGTHVSATGEIGAILLRRVERIRKQIRVEFLCGMRAVRRAAADYEILAGIATGASAAIDELPALVEKWKTDLRARESASRELAAQLDRFLAAELRQSATRTAGGRRLVSWSSDSASVERVRTLAQEVTAEPLSVFVGTIESPPTIILSIGSGSGLDAGGILKPLLGEFGGRGGGNSRLAQGTVPNTEALAELVGRLRAIA
jgi:alanyl-tRNA synthetase